MADKYIIDGEEWEFLDSNDYVDEHLVEKTITENGVYNGTDEADGKRGYSKVTVDVASTPSTLIEKTVTENGEYVAVNDEANGYSKVTVNVDQSGILNLSSLVSKINFNYHYVLSTLNANDISFETSVEENTNS